MIMENFLELARERRSVRLFADRPVDERALAYIMECARVAPSAVNFQPWHFYIVRSAEAQEKLKRTYTRDWFNHAPLYILGCIRHDLSWHRRLDGKDHGDIDIAIATEHICLAAAEQGLGTCWVCNFDSKLCHELLSLPAEEESAVILPIGYPGDGAEDTKRTSRKDMGEIVSEL